MRTATRQKTVGKEFESQDKCEHYEKLLDGTRIVCPDCNGRGRWKQTMFQSMIIGKVRWVDIGIIKNVKDAMVKAILKRK